MCRYPKVMTRSVIYLSEHLANFHCDEAVSCRQSKELSGAMMVQLQCY